MPPRKNEPPADDGGSIGPFVCEDCWREFADDTELARSQWRRWPDGRVICGLCLRVRNGEVPSSERLEQIACQELQRAATEMIARRAGLLGYLPRLPSRD